MDDHYSKAECQKFRRQLTSWYAANHRQLPWRKSRDAYRIWISESMLQQTQVATVLAYFERFVQRFPDVHSLAVADQQEVLQLWAGLGYYRRARNLHLAAQQIVQQFAGQFPDQVSQLQTLAGIGRYTAGAIASLAFDRRAPIVEANTQRLFSRLMALREPVDSVTSQSRLWRFAQSLLPPGGGSGRVNQALMELGSQICTPAQPACHRCPVHEFCAARRQGLEHQLPTKSSKPKPQPLTHVGLLIWNGRKRFLMYCHQPGQWWEGLWDLPWIELESEISQSMGKRQSAMIQQRIWERYKLDVQVEHSITSVRHSVTQYRITYHCLAAALQESSITKGCGLRWTSPLTLPAATARFQRLCKQGLLEPNRRISVCGAVRSNGRHVRT
ncbi:MAG: A/G-specific adenine glycosylase [Pirellulaceae bacterium]|nr:A/G-specific adenine glycosylase [Pirellulaceae bacterium]